MNYTTAIKLMEVNPEASKRFFDLEYKDHTRSLKEIQDFDNGFRLNPFWRMYNDLKQDCFDYSKKCQEQIQLKWKEQAAKRRKVFKEDPELIRARLELKDLYLDNQFNYPNFVRISGLKISEETFNKISVKGKYAETLQNLFKLLEK